jgi:hypothetical protein
VLWLLASANRYGGAGHTKVEDRKQKTENRAQKTEKSDIRFLTSDICLLVLCLSQTPVPAKPTGAGNFKQNDR